MTLPAATPPSAPSAATPEGVGRVVLFPSWRDVRTDPPPTNVSVLIYLPWAEHYGPGIYRAIHVVTEYSNRWHTTGVAIGRDLDWGRPPTHWMPLPPPPTPAPAVEG